MSEYSSGTEAPQPRVKQWPSAPANGHQTEPVHIGGQAGQHVPSFNEKAQTVTHQATAKASHSMLAAAGGLDRLAGTVRQKAPSGKGEQVADLAGHSAETAANALTTAAQYLERSEPVELMNEVEQFVQRKPIPALLAAAAAGFILVKMIKLVA